MALDSPRRAFQDSPKKKGPKDVDAAGRAQRLHALAWSVYGGIPLGAGIGLAIHNLVLGIVVGPVIIFGLVVGLAGVAGRGAGVLYNPSGRSTPRRQEFSRARSLEVRGEYEEALRAYEVAIMEAPLQAEPYLCIARLYRDELKDPGAAVDWFRKAQREARPSAGESVRVHRELAEIFLHVLREPRRAAPELARLAEGYPTTADGRWAATELALIKEELAREHGGLGGSDGGPDPSG